MRQINSTSQDLAFIQVSGDLTNNATDAEFQHYRNGTAASRLPVWPAVGNHEYFNGGQPTYAARIDNYRRHVGPEWYSFDHGNRHFLVLENNGAAPFEEQREWVEATSRRTPRASASSCSCTADERPVRLAVAVRRLRRCSSTTRPSWCWSATSTPTTPTIDLGEGAKHIQTNSSSYTIDHSPRGFRYVQMERERFENPFRMYGVERSLAITSPGARRASHRARRGAGQRLPHVRRGQGVRYRVDGRGAWRALQASGDFTWFGRSPDHARRGPAHARGRGGRRGGTRWSESSTSRATAAGRREPGADWAQFHGDAAHSGVAAGRARAATSRLAWMHRTPGAILTGSPAVADGVAYVGTRDEDGRSATPCTPSTSRPGASCGSSTPTSSVHGSPAVADGIVYVADDPRHAVRDRRATGDERGSARPSGPSRRSTSASYSYYAPAVDGGKVYWPYQTRYGKATSGLLAALDAKTGAADLGVADDRRDDVRRHAGRRRRPVFVGNETADR